MKFEEIYKIWRERFVDVLEETDIKIISADRFLNRDFLWYECPCGGQDHAAARFFIEEGFSKSLSEVITCFINDKQWLIRPIDVAETIRDEEEKYFKLIARSTNIVEKVTAKRGESEETITYLWDTHGIPDDIVRDLWSDWKVK